MNRCMCAPRSLSIHPRCPIHGNHATNVERVQHGMAPQPRTCPKTWRPCERVECAAYCAGPVPAAGVTVTVPVNRPATPEEAEHAARIGACLPNGAMFDAFGRERVRYVRVIHDGTTCVVSPGDVADLVDPGRPDDYRIEDVYLSKEEFDALPEFDGF